MIIYTCYVDI